jgi:hypothetical protein
MWRRQGLTAHRPTAHVLTAWLHTGLLHMYWLLDSTPAYCTCTDCFKTACKWARAPDIGILVAKQELTGSNRQSLNEYGGNDCNVMKWRRHFLSVDVDKWVRMERWWDDTDRRKPTALGSNPNLRRSDHYMSPSLLASLPALIHRQWSRACICWLYILRVVQAE